MRVYAGIFAVLGWFVIIGQYVVSNAHTEASTIDYVSYFTIQSNILVALTFSFAALAPDTSLGRFLLKPATATAVALYITVTGLVYYFILSGLYDLKGWTLRFNELLHYVMPPGFVLFWLLFVSRGALLLLTVPWLLLFPLAYGVYTLVHGAFSGFYPYPFLDVTKLGYEHVFRNIGEFVIFFSLVGAIYVLIDRTIAHFLHRNSVAPSSRAATIGTMER